MGNDSKKKTSSVLDTAKERFRIGMEADAENRKLALEDMEFRAGKQWPDDIKNSRALDNRPCLTINKVAQNVHQLTNEQRQNRPAIKISPFDDNADVESAEVFQGLVRSIENCSNADTAYDIGFDSSVTGGRGYVRLTTEYSDPMSFNQEAKVKPIHDPHSVVLDPTYKEPDGSDAEWGFVIDSMSRDDFKAKYPNAEVSKDTFDFEEAIKTDWYSENTVKVAEYFSKDYEKAKLILLPDGSTVLEKDLKELKLDEKEELGLTDELIKQLCDSDKTCRETQIPVVNWYKINGDEILEQTVWPSRWIPIIPIHGEELHINGQRIFQGIIRQSKDPQKMYNYWATCETESIALAPKVPFVGAEGQFEGHESKWNQAHIKNYAYLEYKPTTLANGEVAPPPQRQFGGVNVQAITQARMLSSDDLKSSSGIYDASLGNRSNESSGIAINRRTAQAQISNFHFVDNLSRSIRHLGRCLVDIIPKIYDAERTVRILGEDDEERIVTLNAIFQEQGKTKHYDLAVGKYDVNVSVGPSYTSKRQEAVDSMIQMSQYNPKIAETASDLMVKNMDWPGAQEIAERLRKTIPPELLDDKSKDPIPPQAQAQIQQLSQLSEQLTEKLNDAQDKLDNKTLELESKERIELAKIDKDLRIKAAELDAKHGAEPEDLSILASEIIAIQERLQLLNIDEPIDQDQIAEGLEQELNAGQPPIDTNLTSEMPLGDTGQEPTE
ncbi:MAG: portal protein [Pseudoalteromonas sp.]